MSICLVVFRLGQERYALPIAAVERIICAVEVTPLPGAPGSVLGAIDVDGAVVPVFDLRQRLQMPQRELRASDEFVLARTAARSVALLIDEVHGVVDCEPSAVVDAGRIAPGLEQFQGLAALDGALVLIHDLEKFLSPDESLSLDQALLRSRVC